MAIYDFSYDYWRYLIPFKRRLPVALAWIKVQLSPLQWLRNNTWNYRRSGSLGNNYNPALAYNKGDIANFGGATYQANQNGTIGVLPTNKTSWTLVAENMVGWEERMLYTGEKKKLEFALYRYFGNYDNTIGFRDRKKNDTTNNSIFIDTVRADDQFIVGVDITDSSIVSVEGDGKSGVIYQDYQPVSTAIAINVPSSLTAYISGSALTTSVLNISKKYLAAGVNATVITY